MKNRILIAMSGGVDSSIAAVLLKDQGYDLAALTMKTYTDKTRSCSVSKNTGCCDIGATEDARSVTAKLGIPHMVMDIHKNFGKDVVSIFKQEYLAGRTPNPCTLCNKKSRFPTLEAQAIALGCDGGFATGHYARVRKENGRYILYKAKDKHKDQSYALWGLSQNHLSKITFPLGDMTKDKVKLMAKERGFAFLAKKKESYEICFIPDNDYRGFLKRNVEGLEQRVKGGEFVLEDGRVVGKHEGYPFYTVGQRRGLDVALGYPVYVTEIQPEHNRVVLGTFDELSRDGMWVHQLNMIKYSKLDKPMDAVVKVRYGDPGTPCVLEQEGDQMKVFFGRGVHAVAPGQSAVFYEGDDVIGGGWIKCSFRKKDKV